MSHTIVPKWLLPPSQTHTATGLKLCCSLAPIVSHQFLIYSFFFLFYISSDKALVTTAPKHTRRIFITYNPSQAENDLIGGTPERTIYFGRSRKHTTERRKKNKNSLDTGYRYRFFALCDYTSWYATAPVENHTILFFLVGWSQFRCCFFFVDLEMSEIRMIVFLGCLPFMLIFTYILCLFF